MPGAGAERERKKAGAAHLWAMPWSDTWKIIIVILILSLVILMSTMGKQRPPSMPFLLTARHNCSFDHIEVCQAGGPEINATFLFIMSGHVGFGSELNQLLLAFAYSVASGRQFLIDRRAWNYGKLSDYFNLLPIGFNPLINYTFLGLDSGKNDKIQHLKTIRTGIQRNRFWLATRHVQSIELKRRVAHYFWQTMSNKTRSFVQKCRLGNLSNYVGVHVRRGDKLNHEARPIPLPQYISAIEKTVQNNQSQTVFVASDVLSTIDNFRKLKPQWTFVNLLFADQRRTMGSGHQQTTFNQLNRQRKYFETNLLICELQMLIEANYVFCTMTSNICRLVQILRHQSPSTVIPLDRSWYGT